MYYKQLDKKLIAKAEIYNSLKQRLKQLKASWNQVADIIDAGYEILMFRKHYTLTSVVLKINKRLFSIERIEDFDIEEFKKRNKKTGGLYYSNQLEPIRTREKKRKKICKLIKI